MNTKKEKVDGRRIQLQKGKGGQGDQTKGETHGRGQNNGREKTPGRAPKANVVDVLARVTTIGGQIQKRTVAKKATSPSLNFWEREVDAALSKRRRKKEG